MLVSAKIQEEDCVIVHLEGDIYAAIKQNNRIYWCLVKKKGLEVVYKTRLVRKPIQKFLDEWYDD